ncbi:ribonuclease M5 [Brochothrix campestris]|uniref:Ribonuclease M5 n=1 Tax=Brochothrix campestris FSL F6-1037 TaxID=1265861 RepID=W7C9B5_9LIST|nr:ribonuclease M5 [Brochothrix campestris]EUJ36054.1 primase/topoisomerase-like protein [Brochothrix campestris FSL F6-1037]
MKIKEVIVVEGKDDTRAIHRAVEADTIETNGSEIAPGTLERIKKAQAVRGVIVFTDPDFPGNKIRQTIEAYVPGCKHAFIERNDARSKRVGASLGVEHASVAVIKEALEHVYTSDPDAFKSEITQAELMALGYLGGTGSKQKRALLGDALKIGYTNGKQLLNRLRMFQITREQFEAAQAAIEKGSKK